MELAVNGARVLWEVDDVPLLGTVQITQTLTVSALVLVMVSGLCIWLGSGLTVTGISRKQAAAEVIVTSLVRFVRSTMGPGFDQYIPLIGTLFATSVASSLVSLVGLWSPTADLMTELAWALAVFALITRHKLRTSGLKGYFKGFLRPFAVMAPINLLSELFTPISMACRHFGNILSGTVISALIYSALTVASDALLGEVFPVLTLGLPAIPSLYFDWFSASIQAFIFCTLTMIFIKQAAEG